MAGGSARTGRDLNATPTWAVALVCAIIVIVSIILEKVLHVIGNTFEKRRKKALVEALEKIKGELMVLGFISLILTFGQNYIAQICISERIANTMLPCPTPHSKKYSSEGEGEHHRRLLSYQHRILAADSPAKECKLGYVPVISVNGLHQLHIFIFFLAVFHVIFGAITMTLGRLKIREWKDWEQETVQNYEASNHHSRFRLTKETSFVRSHASFMTKTPILFYLVCFYRQFFRSVRRADYLTMRHGFVSVHLAPGSKFNFQKYIKRSLEDDFKVVVGISPVLWAFSVIFLLVNVHGWQVMFWLSIMPLVTILAVGAKLQAIITQMAVEIQERHAVIQGIPLVQVSDRHFWFSQPTLVLHLIHLTLFLNAFEITYFIWITYEFGLHSCFHEDFRIAVTRVGLGILVQILCSYITLPLYALVTQMGSNMKKSIFDEQTSKALKNWTKNARKKNYGKTVANSTQTLGGSPGDSPENSPTGSSHPRSLTAGQSTYELPTVNQGSPGHQVNIIASVDIPEESSSSNNNELHAREHDLLTGP